MVLLAGIFLEAESFKNLGGWVVDQQSIRQMGSSYIMAHGMGEPVEDAETVCDIPEDGEWTVWVRTRDWTAPWKRGTPGGTFKLLINGKELQAALGTNGETWGWQKAGSMLLNRGEVTITLHDLTGFNGRCDAVYLTNEDDIPPDDLEKLREFRRKLLNIVFKEQPVEYDLAVVGGGVAGICTAISAIQSGLKVVLIHDRSVLGGCNSSEIRVSMGGIIHTGPYPKLGNVVDIIQPIMGSGRTYTEDFYEDARKINIFRLFPKERYHIALNEHVIDVEKAPEDPHKINAVITQNTLTGSETRYKARLFADCTGDAVIARMMSAEVMYERESRDQYNEPLAPPEPDKLVMGHSVLWYSKETGEETTFPDIDWGIEINEDKVYYIEGGDWEWECGQYLDQVDNIEYIRDYGLMTIFANWSYLKNHSKRKNEWARKKLAWISPIGGKRESYRVVGDLILTQNDVEHHVDYPDSTGVMTWNIDLHFPDPENEAKFAEPFRSWAYHRGIVKEYAVPYRCLYARDVKNLFLGGRHISMTHIAFACVRVMRTLGILGEVIGLADSICIEKNAYPRDVYEKYFEHLKKKMENGVDIPHYHAYKPDDSENYHFKELGYISIYPEFRVNTEDKNLCKRIKKLQVQHKHRHPEF